MKSVQDTYLLHNGVAIPCVGYGTCDTDGEVTSPQREVRPASRLPSDRHRHVL